MYDSKYFQVISSKPIPNTLPGGDKTRDILYVKGKYAGEIVHLFVNHWPSRSGGRMRSEKGRILASQLNKKIIDSILATDSKAKIINMGDFNDNPTDKSIKPILKTVANKSKINSNELFNPTEKLYKKGFGSYNYRGKWDMLDQFMISSEPKYRQQEGNYKHFPYRFWAGNNLLGGYSDHLAVRIEITKEYNITTIINSHDII